MNQGNTVINNSTLFAIQQANMNIIEIAIFEHQQPSKLMKLSSEIEATLLENIREELNF